MRRFTTAVGMAAARRMMRSASPAIRAAGVGAAAGVALFNAAGCVHTGPANPCFAVTHHQAATRLRELAEQPSPPLLPVLLLSGYRDFTYSATGLTGMLIDATGGDPGQFQVVHFPTPTTEDELIGQIIDRVERTWPSMSESETVAVDVVGISMGGLIARAAALPPEFDQFGEVSRKRLRISTLYTLATPHRGANLAKLIAPDAMAQAMKPGSPLLQRLDQAMSAQAGPPPYRIVPYAKLRDYVVGARNAAPPGQDPIWVSGSILGSHVNIQDDPRVVLDVALRLRGEHPIATPSAPPGN